MVCSVLEVKREDLSSIPSTRVDVSAVLERWANQPPNIESQVSVRDPASKNTVAGV